MFVYQTNDTLCLVHGMAKENKVEFFLVDMQGDFSPQAREIFALFFQ